MQYARALMTEIRPFLAATEEMYKRIAAGVQYGLFIYLWQYYDGDNVDEAYVDTERGVIVVRNDTISFPGGVKCLEIPVSWGLYDYFKLYKVPA